MGSLRESDRRTTATKHGHDQLKPVGSRTASFKVLCCGARVSGFESQFCHLLYACGHAYVAITSLLSSSPAKSR